MEATVISALSNEKTEDPFVFAYGFLHACSDDLETLAAALEYANESQHARTIEALARRVNLAIEVLEGLHNEQKKGAAA